jgi:hypothetical protein
MTPPYELPDYPWSDERGATVVRTNNSKPKCLEALAVVVMPMRGLGVLPAEGPPVFLLPSVPAIACRALNGEAAGSQKQ